MYTEYVELLENMITVGEGNDGWTDITMEEINHTMKFVLKSWRRIKREFKCFIRTNPDREAEARAALRTIKYQLIQRTHHHSVFCHINLLQKRVWF